MITASAGSTAAASSFVIVIGLAILAVNVWLFVVAVQFLRVGTRAFKRYLAMTVTASRDAQASQQ
jgi:hypothetical protein